MEMQLEVEMKLEVKVEMMKTSSSRFDLVGKRRSPPQSKMILSCRSRPGQRREGRSRRQRRERRPGCDGTKGRVGSELQGRSSRREGWEHEPKELRVLFVFQCGSL